MVIAIDGPGGVGKSTVAKALAQRLGRAHLDTGAYYRAATLAVLRAGVDPEDGGAAVGALSGRLFDYSSGAMLLDGEDVTAELRGPAVTAAVSTVSSHAALRRLMVTAQREWVVRHGGDAVVEGRDIGTVVFPQAPVKVFLTASPEVRAARRAGDAEATGRDLNEIAADLQRRDAHDSGRDVAPLQPAADALIIDTSDMTARAVVDLIARQVTAAS